MCVHVYTYLRPPLSSISSSSFCYTPPPPPSAPFILLLLLPLLLPPPPSCMGDQEVVGRKRLDKEKETCMEEKGGGRDI